MIILKTALDRHRVLWILSCCSIGFASPCLSLFHLMFVSEGFSETYATTAEDRGSPIPRSGSVERVSGSVDTARSRSQSPSKRILSSAVDADLIQAALREHSRCIIQIERERVSIYVCQQF